MYRRLKFDMILTYKICYRLIDVKFDDFFQSAETGYELHRHSFVLRCKHRPRCDKYHHFFSYRIISVWNLLTESSVSSFTLAAFKTRFKKFDLHDICYF